MQEVCEKITVNNIFNKSFCVMIAVDDFDEDLGLTSHETLSDLKDKMGVYGLWVHHTDCDVHHMHRMLCLYIGKGYVLTRVKKHIQEKWPKEELLYVTFYECENRNAKYIEQLFLDSYFFPLNKTENRGEGFLATAWNDERFVLGTEMHEQGNKLANKFPTSFK